MSGVIIGSMLYVSIHYNLSSKTLLQDMQQLELRTKVDSLSKKANNFQLMSICWRQLRGSALEFAAQIWWNNFEAGSSLVKQGLVQMSLAHLLEAADAQTVQTLHQRGGRMHFQADGWFRRSWKLHKFCSICRCFSHILRASPVSAPPRLLRRWRHRRDGMHLQRVV